MFSYWVRLGLIALVTIFFALPAMAQRRTVETADQGAFYRLTASTRGRVPTAESTILYTRPLELMDVLSRTKGSKSQPQHVIDSYYVDGNLLDLSVTPLPRIHYSAISEGVALGLAGLAEVFGLSNTIAMDPQISLIHPGAQLVEWGQQLGLDNAALVALVQHYDALKTLPAEAAAKRILDTNVLFVHLRPSRFPATMETEEHFYSVVLAIRATQHPSEPLSQRAQLFLLPEIPESQYPYHESAWPLATIDLTLPGGYATQPPLAGLLANQPTRDLISTKLRSENVDRRAFFLNALLLLQDASLLPLLEGHLNYDDYQGFFSAITKMIQTRIFTPGFLEKLTQWMAELYIKLQEEEFVDEHDDLLLTLATLTSMVDAQQEVWPTSDEYMSIRVGYRARVGHWLEQKLTDDLDHQEVCRWWVRWSYVDPRSATDFLVNTVLKADDPGNQFKLNILFSSHLQQALAAAPVYFALAQSLFFKTELADGSVISRALVDEGYSGVGTSPMLNLLAEYWSDIGLHEIAIASLTDEQRTIYLTRNEQVADFLPQGNTPGPSIAYTQSEAVFLMLQHLAVALRQLEIAEDDSLGGGLVRDSRRYMRLAAEVRIDGFIEQLDRAGEFLATLSIQPLTIVDDDEDIDDPFGGINFDNMHERGYSSGYLEELGQKLYERNSK